MVASARVTRTLAGPGATLSQQSQRHRSTTPAPATAAPRRRQQILNSKQRGLLILLPFIIVFVLALRSLFTKHPSPADHAVDASHPSQRTFHDTPRRVRSSGTYRRSKSHSRRSHHPVHVEHHDIDSHEIVKLDHGDTPHGHGHPLHHHHGHHEAPSKVVLSGANFQNKASESPASLSRAPFDTTSQAKAAVASTNNAALPKISAVVLFHSEYPTLIHTLDTWERNGLVPAVAEFIFFLNGVQSREEFDRQVPRIREDPQWRDKTRVVTSPENRALGLAIREMVRLASNELVLLMEKDWALIEPPQQVQAQLAASASLLQSGTVHLVRYRHRHRPGAPLHARIMHEGRERQMLQQQSNLYCFMHHWVHDMAGKYPDYFHKCPGDAAAGLSEPMWCASARYCQWTNNPGLFYRNWFLQNLGDPFERDYQKTLKTDPGAKPGSGHLDFEFYMNWNENVWNGRNYTIGLPLGLFEHQEVGENNIQNTVWYGWNRLNTDVEEKKAEYFATERTECTAGVKSHASGPLYKDKFPLAFVHLYHYNRAMTRSVNEAVRELNEKGTELVGLLEKEQSNWRVCITDLTNLHYEKILFSYPIEPSAMQIGFVTSVYEGVGIPQAVENINRIGKTYSAIVYADEQSAERIRISLKNNFGWTANEVQDVKFIVENLNDMAQRILGTYVISKVNDIMNGTEWKTLAASRNGGSPPRPEEIKVRLAKPLLMRDVEHKTTHSMQDFPYKSRSLTHFVWMDASSMCVAEAKNAFNSKAASRPRSTLSDHVFRGNMLLNPMVTGKRVTSDGELGAMLGRLSGFSIANLLAETEVRNLPAEGLSVLDGRTIGGPRLAINLMAAYYDAVLRDMLNKGRLGTEREPLTIAHKNVEYNFRFLDAWHMCSSGDCGAVEDVSQPAHSEVDSRSGCRLYQSAAHCAINASSR